MAWKKRRTLPGTWVWETKPERITGLYHRIVVVNPAGNVPRMDTIQLDRGGRVENRDHEGFRSISAALRAAKSYMRRYPNG